MAEALDVLRGGLGGKRYFEGVGASTPKTAAATTAAALFRGGSSGVAAEDEEDEEEAVITCTSFRIAPGRAAFACTAGATVVGFVEDLSHPTPFSCDLT